MKSNGKNITLESAQNYIDKADLKDKDGKMDLVEFIEAYRAGGLNELMIEQTLKKQKRLDSTKVKKQSSVTFAWALTKFQFQVNPII